MQSTVVHCGPMRSTKLNVRIPESTDSDLAQAAALFGGKSEAIRVLLDQGLRSVHFPGVYFMRTGSGLNTAFIEGFKVWPIVDLVLGFKDDGVDDPVSAAIEYLGVNRSLIERALEYYSAYREELDDQIALNERLECEQLARSQGVEELLN